MIILDYRNHQPIYEQIVERFKELILKGIFPPESQLPSVRNLAMELSINPNTIQRAFGELERQGYIYSVKGKGNFIADSKKLKEEKQNEMLLKLGDFIREAKDMGIRMEQMIQVLYHGYEEGDKHD